MFPKKSVKGLLGVCYILVVICIPNGPSCIILFLCSHKIQDCKIY